MLGSVEAAFCRDEIVAPSSLTPQSIRPQPLRPRIAPPPFEQPRTAKPELPSNLDVLVADVQIVGAFPELGPSNDVSARGLIGQRLTVSRIYQFAKTLEEIYARAGYIFARVTVPPQNLVDNGRLIFVVVDGFIESLDLVGVPEPVRAVVAERILPLVGRHHLQREDIERAMLLAGDIPGLTLKSTLARGNGNGGVKLVLSGEHKPVTVSIGTDNRNQPAAGTWQLRGAIAANGLAGFGEQIYGTFGSATDLRSLFDGHAPLMLYGGGVIVPVGTDGLTVNPEFTSSKTSTPTVAGTPATTGKFDRIALRLRSVVTRSQKEALNFGVAVEYIKQDIQAPDFNATINTDRYAVLRAGPEYELNFGNASSLRGGFSVSQGLTGRTGMDAAASGIPLSRTGTTPTFTKVNVSGRYSQPLFDVLRWDVYGSGQTSLGKPVFRSEQFALDGNEGVSAFAAGTFNSDTGAVVRTEISRPFDFRLDGQNGARSAYVAPYVFGATGRGWLYSTTGVEQSKLSASAVGVGLRGGADSALRDPGLSFGIECARQFTDALDQKQGWRANVFATVAF